MSLYHHLLSPNPKFPRDENSLVLSFGDERMTLKTLRLHSLCFARALRDVLANWWPFRKGDVVGIVVPSAFLDGSGLGPEWRLDEMLIAMFGVIRAGGTACLIPYRHDLRNTLTELHGSAVGKALPTSTEIGLDPSTPRVLVTPYTVRVLFPVLNYGNPPESGSHKRMDLMTRTVGDMVARGLELNDDVLPNWAKEDEGRWAIWWEDLILGREYPAGKGWTHKQLIDMLKLSNDPNKSSITFDPRTCGAPNSILTNFLEPLAKGRPVEFKKLSDFVRIKLKL